MRRIIVASAVATLTASLAATTVRAQTMGSEPYPLSFGVAAGATIPVGDLGDAQSTGWNIMGLVDWTTPSTPVGFRADVTYNNLSGKTLTFAGQPTIETDNRNLFEVTGDAVWHFRPSTTTVPNPWEPYVLGGIGIYHFADETVTTGFPPTQQSSGSATKFGLNIGGGVVYRLSGFSTFAEARFHDVFVSGGSAKFFPISFGVRFGGS
jgi:opacity protein-like surface antigen